MVSVPQRFCWRLSLCARNWHHSKEQGLDSDLPVQPEERDKPPKWDERGLKRWFNTFSVSRQPQLGTPASEPAPCLPRSRKCLGKTLCTSSAAHQQCKTINQGFRCHVINYGTFCHRHLKDKMWESVCTDILQLRQKRFRCARGSLPAPGPDPDPDPNPTALGERITGRLSPLSHQNGAFSTLCTITQENNLPTIYSIITDSWEDLDRSLPATSCPQTAAHQILTPTAGPAVRAAPSPLPLPQRCAAGKHPQIKQFCLDTQTRRDLPLTQQILLKVGTVKTNTVACSTLPRLLLTALVRRRRCWVLCYNEEEDSVGKGVEFDTEVSRAGKRKSRKSALCHLKLLWH